MKVKEPHDSATAHVRGDSIFVDDRPPLPGELQVEVVYSSVQSGLLRRIDASRALQVPGVSVCLTAKDLSHNRWGTIFQDQPFLAEDQVNYVGEPIAILAGADRYALCEAKRLLEIDIEATPSIQTIDQAIEQNSFHGFERSIARGDARPEEAPHQLEGVIRLAGQDHFYLESQAAIAYPGENGSISIHASSQHPTEVQHLVAEALGLRFRQVDCVVKRMGGAFGGKESQAAPFAVFAALVAQKTGKAARLVLTKDDDMIMTGKRNPFQIHYRVGFDDEGRLLALEAKLFSDGGAYADLSTAIMERAMLHSDNAYYIPNVRLTGRVCKTNFHPSTAFRGFGGPKGVLAIESIIEDVAQCLAMDALQVRKANVYGKTSRNVTPYGQTLEDNSLPDLFADLERRCNYKARREEVDTFNVAQKDYVRGLSLTAVKFGISFTTRFLNQGSALVNVHLDGTVQVSTGATEMGQGVNTKIAIIVAETFGIAPRDVAIMPTSTEKNHNTSPTAASSGSDLNGQAALNASLKIRRRLEHLAVAVLARPTTLRGRAVAGSGTAQEIMLPDEPLPPRDNIVFADGEVYDESNPGARLSFTEMLEEAFLNRISLGEHGFYRYPGVYFNKETGQGSPFLYFTNGVAASEVQIDKLTGEVKVLRSDILMDLGRPINHGIDLGQVSGAFVQGMGWLTTENLFYDAKGLLRSHSPSTYKIPSVHDTPRTFNIDLLEGAYCKPNLKGSKAVGEPPLLLAVSVWTAIKNALAYVRPKAARHLSVPATAEVILDILDGDPQ